ncbi:LapA family protein [Acidobacterium sp. S8]|uniref:LapA family protein n=1 Tax=Acidobacterium sp. S8 TaxID=1641854 RepID=UPI00131AACAB|nr:LapA family protein [Acidobacterium sp. S8]
MTFHWPILVAVSVLGVILGVLADWQLGTRFRKRLELRALTREYGSLAGQYLNYRILDDGRHEPTGGIVEITWQPRDGLLDVSGFHSTGHPEWHSYIRMNREYAGTGIGHYNNVNSIHGGIQQVLYSKHTRSFNVMGTSHTHKEFAHCWKPKESDQPTTHKPSAIQA